MKKKLLLALISVVLALAGVWRLWQFHAYPYTFDDLPIVWQEDSISLTVPPTGADQLCVFLSGGSLELPQVAIRFGEKTMNLLTSCRYQRCADLPDEYGPDSPQWRGGYEIFLLNGERQARLYWDVNLWVPTDEGWTAYSLNTPKNVKQQLIGLQIEYHNDVIPILNNTIWS